MTEANKDKAVTLEDLKAALESNSVLTGAQNDFITTDDIDAIVDDGETKTGDQPLKLTGFSYFWNKLKSKFASIASRLTSAESNITTLKNDSIKNVGDIEINASQDTVQYWANKGSLKGYLSIYNSTYGSIISIVTNLNNGVKFVFQILDLAGYDYYTQIRRGYYFGNSEDTNWSTLTNRGWDTLVTPRTPQIVTNDMLANTIDAKKVGIGNLNQIRFFDNGQKGEPAIRFQMTSGKDYQVLFLPSNKKIMLYDSTKGETVATWNASS